ncbi:MAG: threonine/serine dehydratase [Planctomycetes bacterium]|nr:threonine/serine dehydratase [Planctomycetota bacterium]
MPTPELTDALSLTDVFAARRRLSGHVIRTPLVRSDWLSAKSSADAYLKLESLQITNSFKLRGAWNAAQLLLERLAPGEAPPPLVTASAGNHGRALAYAAERLGLRVTIFTPRDAPRSKLEAIVRHGADLRAEASSYEDSERLAKQFAVLTGAIYLSPYSHPDLLAGVGTIGLEILEDLPDVEVVVVPVGGGGLISGVAAVLKLLAPRVVIVGVEAEASHPFTSSLAAGCIVEVEVRPTLADGLAGNMDPETITFDLVRRLVDRLALVSEAQMADGIRGLVAHEHLIAEGAGVAAVGAMLGGRVDVRGRRAAILVSGSNIDAAKLAAVLSSLPRP